MKYRLFISLLLIIPLSTTCSQPQKVYICRSGTSYAYHNRICQGLRNCTHKIDTVTIPEAVKTGHKKPCGYCYKKGALNQIQIPMQERSVRKIRLN